MQSKGLNSKFPRLYTPRLMLKQPLDEDRDFLTKLFSDPKVMRYLWDGPLDFRHATMYADAIIALSRFSINHG
jgi:RimJ/RimL family protein N-acetyltransferase